MRVHWMLFLLGTLSLSSCSDSKTTSPSDALRLARDGSVQLRVLLPDDTEDGLFDAAWDLARAAGEVCSAQVPDDAVSSDPASEARQGPVVRIDVNAALVKDLGSQGYRLSPTEEENTVVVSAATRIGAMYGLYDLSWRLGVRYIHPEETFYPSIPEAALPVLAEAITEVPDFDYRGFHEHTQHPIPASDFFLRPGSDEFRGMASRYLKWLARNRQNVVTFHMLKTVDLELWIPYMTDIVSEAHRYGIQIGPLVSFSDQQQNAFKLISADNVDPSSQEPFSDDDQIRQGLTQVLSPGFDLVGFQIGTSEFTRVPDETVLSWLETARSHLADELPQVTPYVWIHITCNLHAESGGPFYHLPLQSDPSMGAYVHTTMFYTLDDPAPVYDCEDFAHQQDFLEAAAAQNRPQVFFPESAWWLGFDNNLPLLMPITGWSRQVDIQEVLPRFKMGLDGTTAAVHGHATFTTGREWTYWQIDHYLTRVTWDNAMTWEAYLDDIVDMYGTNGPQLMSVLKDWTLLQKRHFYEENPEIYFYLAGELPQDELGLMSGILARRPKIPFPTVLAYGVEEFSTWHSRDFEMLQRMQNEYAALIDPLPAVGSPSPGDLTGVYEAELREAMELYVERIDHAVTLYAAVIEARSWVEESRQEVPDPTLLEQHSAAAEDLLEQAREITTRVHTVLKAAEARYRYPLEIVAQLKPESPTAYKFGYLYETSTAYFWSRRDDQLATLLADTFGASEEAWTEDPERVLRSTPETTRMTEPDDPLAAAVLTPFIPPFLWGLTQEGDFLTLTVAQDYSDNHLPDAGTEATLTGAVTGNSWEGELLEYGIAVRDASGARLGTLTVLGAVFELELNLSGSMGVVGADNATLKGEVPSSILVDVVVSATAGGIDREGVSNILKDVFGIPEEDPLPERLPIRFEFDLAPL